MANLLAPDNHGDGKKHDEDVDTGLGAEGVDVACLVNPWDDAVEEAEGDDVLGDRLARGKGIGQETVQVPSDRRQASRHRR